MLELVLYDIRLLASRFLGTVLDFEWRTLPLDQGGGEVLHVRFFDDDCKEQSRAILVAYATLYAITTLWKAHNFLNLVDITY